MKRIGNWIVAATLFCGLSALTSCEDESDNPVDDGGSEYVIQNRDIILSHIESDAKILADNVNPAMYSLTNGVFSQLMTLMAKDRNYMSNMKQILTMMVANGALVNIRPVAKDSELAAMGYQMYIPVDIQTFGLQVVFDENGLSRLFPCEGMEFIFPATVEGLGTTLYKVAFKAGSSWKETVIPARLNGLKGLACVWRWPETLTMTLSGLFDGEVQPLVKTTFDVGDIQEGKVRIDCGYVNAGLNVMTLSASATLPDTIDEFDVLILDDLRLYGSVSNGEVQGRLISQEAFYPLEFRLKAGVPTIWSFEHLGYVPLSELIPSADVDAVNRLISSVMPPVGDNTFITVQLFSQIMQMLPLNSAEWGL